MLKWFSSKLQPGKSDHPLGTDAAIAEYLDGLSAGRPEHNLLELAEWLGEPLHLSATLAPDRAIRAIIKLDEAAERTAAVCWSQFLAEARVDHLAEQKLKALDTYYQGAQVGYRHALDLLVKTPTAAGNNLAGLNGLFAQRALGALAGRMRISHIRYRVPDAAWWQAVGLALSAAQTAGATQLKQRAYANDAFPASPWIEYLVILFFEIAPLGNLDPQQMELLYRLLRWLEPHFTVQGRFGTQSPFYIRLDKPGAPVKAAEPLPPDPCLVYFGPGLAYGQLVRLRSMLKDSGELFEWMLLSRCPFDKAMMVVDALIMNWSERPPERRFKRERKEAPMRVVNGLSQIRRMVAFSEFARSGRKVGYKTHLNMLKFERFGFADTTKESGFDEARWENQTPLETIQLLETGGDKAMMDEWSMRDVSATGLGAIAPFLKPWMIIGSYIGYRLDDEIDWRIGIVRRIHRVHTGHPSVGIEIMPEVPRCAEILPLNLVPGADPWAHMVRENPTVERRQDAIVLSTSASRMLIPTGVFAADKLLALVLSGSRVPVRLKSVVHQNADCDCVEYEFCEQSTDDGLSLI